MIGAEAAYLLLWDNNQNNIVMADPNAKWNRYNSRTGFIVLTEKTFYGTDDVSKALAIHEAAHAILHKGIVLFVLWAEFRANVYALKWLRKNPICNYRKARKVLWIGFLFYLVPRLVVLAIVILIWLL